MYVRTQRSDFLHNSLVFAISPSQKKFAFQNLNHTFVRTQIEFNSYKNRNKSKSY